MHRTAFQGQLVVAVGLPKSADVYTCVLLTGEGGVGDSSDGQSKHPTHKP